MKKIALLLLLAPLALTACGGGSPNVDLVAYVKHSAQKTSGTTSEHMTMTMTVSAAGQNISMNASGDYLNSPLKGSMSMSMSLMGRAIKINALQEGTTYYMSSPVFARALPSGKTWMKLDMSKAESKLGLDYSSLMSQSPTQALERLEAAGSVKSIGTETIDGAETTHYQVTNLDLSKIPQGAKLAVFDPKFGPIDVWIGNKDRYVYRESFSFTMSVEGQSASMKARIDFSKFGENVNVTIPPASEVFDATSLANGGLGG